MLSIGGGELREGYHRSQMGKECSRSKGANLSHDKVTGLLKLPKLSMISRKLGR